MIGRWLRRLRGEPPTDSPPKAKGPPIEELAKQELPFRWGPYLLLEYLGTTAAGEIFIGKRPGAEPVDVGQPSSVEELARELLIIRRGLVRMDSSPYLQLRLSEMGIFKQLSHPLVCPFVEAGECEGAPVIVSKYLLGKTLLDLMGHYRRQQRPLPWMVATFIAHELCIVLEYLHDKGDQSGSWNVVLSKLGLSPADIFIDYSGQVRVANIGLRLGQLPEGWGILDHTPLFLSPEAVMGQVPSPSADIFCAGSLLWELVTGQKIFAGQTDFETLMNIKNVVLQPATDLNPEVPQQLEDVIVKALAKEPSARHARACDLRRELAELADLDAAKDELATIMNSIFSEARDRAHAKMQRWR